MTTRAILFALCAASAMLAQDGPRLLTKVPNPVSQNRPEVNAGFMAKIPVLEHAPTINNTGDLSDWAGAYRVEHAFMPFIPVDKGEPKFRADAYLAWGKDGLYIAIEVFTDPKQIVGPLQARDRNFSGQDYLQILVDPQGKGSSGVLLSLSARNVQADATWIEGGFSDNSFDMIWNSGTAITGRGWVAKVKIPFSSLRRSPGDWLVLMSLAQTRGGVSYSEYYPQAYLDVQCVLCQSQKLGNAPIQNEASTLMVAPRLFQSRTESLSDGTLHNPQVENRNGVEFRYQATRYAVEGTYRPDFATIEADVNPLNVNNRYRYQYPDKRPFMMSGLDTFGDFNTSWFNFLSTRSIIAPEWGFKGYGEAGNVSWGFIQTKDQNGGNSIASDGLADTFGRATTDTVFGSSIGFGSGASASKLAVSASNRGLLGGSSWYSRAYGLSYFQQIGANWNATVQGLRSDASLPSTYGGNLPKSGFGTNFSLNCQYENFYASASNTSLSPDLRLDAGFLALTALRDNFVSAGYSLRNNGWWQSLNATLMYDGIRNWDGSPQAEGTSVTLAASLTGPTSVSVSQSLSKREWWLGELFQKSSTTMSLYYGGFRNQFAQAKISCSYQFGKGIDYARVSSAKERNPSVNLTLNAGSLYANAQWQDRAIYDDATGALNIRATRLFLYLEQVLPKDFFWRVQYQPVKYLRPLDTNPWLITDTTRSVSVQYLVGWRPNPFSGFYLGWNGVRGTVPTEFDPRHEQLISKGLFAKGTYAFTF